MGEGGSGSGELALQAEWRTLLVDAYEEIRDDLIRVDADICDRLLRLTRARFLDLLKLSGAPPVTFEVSSGSAPEAVDVECAASRIAGSGMRLVALDLALLVSTDELEPELGGHRTRGLRAAADVIDDLRKEFAIDEADLLDVLHGGYPLALATGIAKHVHWPGWTVWSERLARTDIRWQLAAAKIRSKPHELRLAPEGNPDDVPDAETGFPKAHRWPGTRFSLKLDRAGLEDVAGSARLEPRAVRADGSPLGLFEPAGGSQSLEELRKRHSTAATVTRAAREKAEKAAVGQAKKRAGDVATTVAVAAGVTGVALAAAPLALAALVGASPTAVRAVVRTVRDEPADQERRAWVAVTDPTDASLFAPTQALTPTKHQHLWEAELEALRARAVDALARMRAEHMEAGNASWLDVEAVHDHARERLNELHAEAHLWCRAHQYPESIYQLVLFDGGDDQLVELLWKAVGP